MTEYIFSKHAMEMMNERSIAEEWIWRALSNSENNFSSEDGNLHFTKAITERDDRILHVVTNPNVSPKRIVTVFFDRRLRSKK